MTNEKDKLKQNLEKVAEERGDQQAVSYQDLFSPMFMQKNTSFATIDVFVRELGLKYFQEKDWWQSNRRFCQKRDEI